MLNPDPAGRNSPARRPLAAGVPPANSDQMGRLDAGPPIAGPGPKPNPTADPSANHPRTTALTTPRTKHHGTGAVAFSTKGEYGVRLMVQLGRRYGEGPASLAEIAADEDLPRAYLEQLVTSLRDAGLVTATRGARGGYQLTAPPSEIRMGEVLRALEGPIAPMFCASDDPDHAECARSARCTVNLLWVKVRDAISSTLDSLTLADLVPVRHIVLDPREPVASPAGLA
jgi:Rrf2 family transcriptional regulator, cysteine metabolism repressor